MLKLFDHFALTQGDRRFLELTGISPAADPRPDPNPPAPFPAPGGGARAGEREEGWYGSRPTENRHAHQALISHGWEAIQRADGTWVYRDPVEGQWCNQRFAVTVLERRIAERP